MKAILGILILLSLQGCGAKANDRHAEIVPGPSGVTCYALIEDGQIKGGNCL